VNASDLTAEAKAELQQPGHDIKDEEARKEHLEKVREAEKTQPLVPADSDFNNFPANPATPAGVPGAFGAGAYKPSNQPERK